MPYITNESRFGQPEQRYFSLGAAPRQEVIRKVCTPQIRKACFDCFDAIDNLSVFFTGGRIIALRDRLALWADFIRDFGEQATSYGMFRSNDLPSIRAALAIINPIVDAVKGDEKLREAA